MLNHEWIRKTEEFLKDKFAHATEFEQPDIAYRIEHTYRVANIGREIAQQEGFDETEMVIACLLHDVSYCEAEGEGRFWPTVREHGRRSAQMARPFLEELGLPKDRIGDICYGIAIHADGKADFPGEETPFALTVSDADNIDRLDVYRLHEAMNLDAFLEKPFAEKLEYVEKRLASLPKWREEPTGTKTAAGMWKARIDFRIEFYQKLADQLRRSESIIGD